jgi:hypothetical protein
MKHIRSGFILVLALLAGHTPSAVAAEPNADQLIRQMSTTLAAAKRFSFSATRTIDAALLEGRDIPEKARIELTVQRPDTLSAISRSNEGTRRFVADGRTLSILDQKSNHYAVVPMQTTIDGLVDRLDQKFGFTPPLAEFALSDPYSHFRRQTHTTTYLGRAKSGGGFLGLGGVECHRIQLSGKVADAELWIGVNDHLPRQLIATFHHDGHPQLKIRFSSWNLNAPAPANGFTFVPPKGCEKIEMWTTAEMQAAAKR